MPSRSEQSTHEYTLTPATGRYRRRVALMVSDAEGTIPIRGSLTIGRGMDNDIVLQDRFVSERHCEIKDCAGGARVRDLGSRNGTLINGARVTEGRLVPGSYLALGRATILCIAAEERHGPPTPGGFVGRSAEAQRLLATVRCYAPRDAAVLIEGETGSGKELIATAFHELSGRTGPLVAVNCAALSPELAMSELFGHERGAFTGAVERHAGAFEQARGGTLFLDEVGELEPRVQAALLRALETGAVRRVGSKEDITVGARVVSATNRNLRRDAAIGHFRPDLYHRLAVLSVFVPPLRKRIRDLPLIAEALLTRTTGPTALSAGALLALKAHTWPGNVRELRNVLERAAAMARGPMITAGDLQIDLDAAPEAQLIPLVEAVREHGGISAAAKAMGVPRTTLRDRVKRLERRLT